MPGPDFVEPEKLELAATWSTDVLDLGPEYVPALERGLVSDDEDARCVSSADEEAAFDRFNAEDLDGEVPLRLALDDLDRTGAGRDHASVRCGHDVHRPNAPPVTTKTPAAVTRR